MPTRKHFNEVWCILITHCTRHAFLSPHHDVFCTWCVICWYLCSDFDWFLLLWFHETYNFLQCWTIFEHDFCIIIPAMKAAVTTIKLLIHTITACWKLASALSIINMIEVVNPRKKDTAWWKISGSENETEEGVSFRHRWRLSFGNDGCRHGSVSDSITWCLTTLLLLSFSRFLQPAPLILLAFHQCF